jgi:LysR family transcriptional regulator, benzoate and cis,cis-muconate-responsive activator of ben and cat genes
MIELRHLRYFLAVAAELNFRRAAERLHISHPALSKQIHDLEYHVGVTLLQRNTARVSLTPAGQSFVEHATDILARVDQAVDRLRTTTVDSENLIVGSPVQMWGNVFPDALKRFRSTHPKAKVSMVNKAPREQFEALRQGQIHIAFVSEHEASESHTFMQKRLLRSTLGVILGRDHRLSRRKQLRWEDIRDETVYHLGVGRGSPHLQDIRRILPGGALKPSQIRDVDGIESLVTFVTSEHGITLLPREFVSMRRSQICYRPLVDARVQRAIELWAMWVPGKQNKLVQDFIDTLQTTTTVVETHAPSESVHALLRNSDSPAAS